MFKPGSNPGKLAVFFLIGFAPALFSQGIPTSKNENVFQKYLSFGSLVKGGTIPYGGAL